MNQKTDKENAINIDIGIETSKRQEVASGLSAVLPDAYTLCLKTHNCDWNVTGPMFQTLHLMFEFSKEIATPSKKSSWPPRCLAR